jgi:hypothetical protein
MNRLIHALLVLTLVGIPLARAAAPPPATRLTAKDRALLQGLLEKFLFDPRGAVRVRVPVVEHRLAQAPIQWDRAGWLKADSPGGPARVYFTDGEAMTAPPSDKRKQIDFVEQCRQALDAPEGSEKGVLPEDDLVVAAWLYRLGHEELAARALARGWAWARKYKCDPVAQLSGYLARHAREQMAEAYVRRADSEALAHAERLCRLYPKEAKGEDRWVLKALQRHQRRGTLGRPRPPVPARFNTWEVKQKIAYLIDALEDVEVEQWGIIMGGALIDYGLD